MRSLISIGTLAGVLVFASTAGSAAATATASSQATAVVLEPIYIGTDFSDKCNKSASTRVCYQCCLDNYWNKSTQCQDWCDGTSLTVGAI